MDDVLSNEALDDLERKRQAATPGPWTPADQKGLGASEVYTDTSPEWESVCSAETSMDSPDDDERAQNEANAAYIAAANPEAVGKLVSEVRAWRRLNEELKAQGVHLKNAPGEKT